jgi:Beta-lactamase enzyme family
VPSLASGPVLKRRQVPLAAALAACLLSGVAAWALTAGPVAGQAPSDTGRPATVSQRKADAPSTPPGAPAGAAESSRAEAGAAYPSRAAIAAAVRYLDGRAGRTSLAVLDSGGHLSGVRLRSHFQSASVVKVMFLTAFLQRLHADRRGVSALDRSLLYPMIHESNNDAASAVLDRIGGAAVARVAREAGMRDYAPGVGWWAFTQTSAADQARFFIDIERLIPGEFWPYARGLLAGIEPEQSWGVPEVARPRWQVFFKTGALPSEGLFNETARLERPGVTFAVSVFSTGDPSQAYGEETMRGVAARLLVPTPSR